MPLIERFELQHIDRPAGSIVVAESDRNVPFPIRRVYFLHHVPGTQTRGGHAHKTLMQIAVCARGSCRFRLDDGLESADIVMATPHEGILIRPMIWHDMTEFSEDCIFLVLASERYDESDYIRSYDEFKHAASR